MFTLAKFLRSNRMPTYDYKCKKCGYKFELFQTMTADPMKECPKCKGEVKRLIGTGQVRFLKEPDFIKPIIKIP